MKDEKDELLSDSSLIPHPSSLIPHPFPLAMSLLHHQETQLFIAERSKKTAADQEASARLRSDMDDACKHCFGKLLGGICHVDCHQHARRHLLAYHQPDAVRGNIPY